jgi:sugar phosphate isomerase/epimerase
LKFSGLAVVAGSIPASLDAAENPTFDEKRSAMPCKLGIASYSFRAFTLDQSIEMTKRVGVKRITLKEVHLPLKSTDEEIKIALKKISDGGIELSSLGVVYMKTEDEVRNAFRYAKAAGVTMMVGVPDLALVPFAEKCVKESDISLAIHNHGPTDLRFPSPEDVYRAVSALDPRMGLCIDVGHTQRLGLDPSKEVERFYDRVLDIHIKDVSSADAKGTTVEIGRGVIDIPKLLATLRRLNYAKTLHLEFEKDQKDPLPGVAESIGYLRGAMALV